jgi:hypothetical protein
LLALLAKTLGTSGAGDFLLTTKFIECINEVKNWFTEPKTIVAKNIEK